MSRWAMHFQTLLGDFDLMNIIVKSAIAGVLALGATGAYALGVPDSGSSDLILVVQNTTNLANVYALDTGISINSVMPSAGLVNGAGATLDTSLAGINSTIAASATLQAFLAANPAASDGWTLESAQYSGAFAGASPNNPNSKNAGLAKSVFTSPGNPANIQQTILSNWQGGLLGGIENDVTAPSDGLGLQALATSKESTNVSLTVAASSKYNMYQTTSDLGAVGTTALALYGFTGNGDTGAVQSYILGSATLAANGTLTINGNGGSPPPPPVPLPAAVWLFGSGLMGLVGVSRRRKAAAAV
jgi:hypothetical protein